MIVRNKPLKGMLIVTIIAVIAGCGKAKKKTPTDETTVAMGGHLLISDTTEAGSSLADTTDYSVFKLVCNTLGADAQTCEIAVGQDGAFAGDCPGFKDKSNGCVLEESGTVIGNVVFDQNPVITPSGGQVTTTITLTKATGDITTTVDKDQSGALSGDANTSQTTWSTPINGSWATTCSTDTTLNSRFFGHERCAEGKKVFIDTIDAAKGKYALWENKDRYDACVPASKTSASETTPDWHVTLDADTSISLKFSTVAELEASLDAIHNALPAVIKTSVDNAASDISGRAIQLKRTVDLIRASTSADFGGVLHYRVPSDTELQRRLTLKLLLLKPLQLADTEFCGPLVVDETLPSMYRRTHSIDPELICRFKTDGQLNALKTFVTAATTANCLPDLFYDVAYNNTSRAEEVVLKCVGSSAADSACFDATSNFVGQVNGRSNVMQLNNRSNGAFDLYQKQATQLIVVHPLKGLLPCAIQYESVIKGYKDSDDHFQATVASRVVNRCDGSGANQELSEWYGARISAVIKRLTTLYKADFTRS